MTNCLPTPEFGLPAAAGRAVVTYSVSSRRSSAAAAAAAATRPSLPFLPTLLLSRSNWLLTRSRRFAIDQSTPAALVSPCLRA